VITLRVKQSGNNFRMPGFDGSHSANVYAIETFARLCFLFAVSENFARLLKQLSDRIFHSNLPVLFILFQADG
jgi:hypothetical protein